MSLRLCFSLFLACLGAVAARGQVTFTFVGTAQFSALGYTEGQPVTFSVTTGASFGSEFSSFGEGNNWPEELYSEPQLFMTVTGTGLTGSLIRPGDLGDGLHDPYSYIQTSYDYKWLTVFVGNDTGLGLGLALPLATALRSFYVSVDVSSGPFSWPSSSSDPIPYFLERSGTYGDICESSFTLYDTEDGSVSFNVSSLTISPIPEPSTYAAVFGAAALGLAGLRRFKRR